MLNPPVTIFIGSICAWFLSVSVASAAADITQTRYMTQRQIT
jgi:hypothetical protein